MVVVPVVAENSNGQPPYIPSFTLGSLSDMELPVSNHVAEGIDKLNTVPAHANRHYPQPCESI